MFHARPLQSSRKAHNPRPLNPAFSEKSSTMKTTRTTLITAIIAAAIGIAVIPLTAGAAKVAKAEVKQNARPEGINLDMIYMPPKDNGICNDAQGAANSCMVDVVVTYADGVKRKGFGVLVGHDLIATDYELVTGHGESHAVKPGDSHTYTVALSNGTTRQAKPWAFVPGTVAVLRMQ